MRAVSFLQLVRKVREETSAGMAARLGVGIKLYSMIERGDRTVAPELAEQIATILKVDQDELFSPQRFKGRTVNGKGELQCRIEL